MISLESQEMISLYLIMLLIILFVAFFYREVRECNEKIIERNQSIRKSFELTSLNLKPIKNFLKKWQIYCQEPENLVSIATLIGVFFYTYLTNEQLITSRDSLADSQRAFMFSSDFVAYSPTDGLIGLAAIWKNSGNTPTKDLIIWTTGQTLSKQMDAKFDFPDNPPQGAVEKNLWVHSFVGPQATFTSRPFIQDYDLSTIDKTKFLYLWGWAKYRDIFQDNIIHVTRWCEQIYWVDPNTKQVFHRPCDFGNCADDECRTEGIPPP